MPLSLLSEVQLNILLIYTIRNFLWELSQWIWNEECKPHHLCKGVFLKCYHKINKILHLITMTYSSQNAIHGPVTISDSIYLNGHGRIYELTEVHSVGICISNSFLHNLCRPLRRLHTNSLNLF